MHQRFSRHVISPEQCQVDKLCHGKRTRESESLDSSNLIVRAVQISSSLRYFRDSPRNRFVQEMIGPELLYLTVYDVHACQSPNTNFDRV